VYAVMMQRVRILMSALNWAWLGGSIGLAPAADAEQVNPTEIHSTHADPRGCDA